MRGEHSNEEDDGVMSYIKEHILLRYTSLSLDQIRELDMYDFEVHGQLAMIFQASEQGAYSDAVQKKKAPTAAEVLSGGRKGDNRGTTIKKRFDPNVGDFV